MAMQPGQSAADLVGSDALQQRFVRNSGQGDKEITLQIDGISCAGCIPRIESNLRQIAGVKSAAINHANRRAFISWDPRQTDVRQLLERTQALGYEVRPYQAIDQEGAILEEKKKSLTRLMIAVACGMQVMMVTVALYFGEAGGMEDIYRQVLRYTAMLFTLPVLLISAAPFFSNAWHGIRSRAVNVDLTVSLALGLAFAGSVMATLGYGGQVYYESVVMFVVLLLTARYLETLARQKGISAISEMEKSMPETALRIEENGEQVLVDVNELSIGQHVLVAPGALVPIDGEVLHGDSVVNEAIITGESYPVSKVSGDKVVAGSINLQNSLTICVDKPAQESAINKISRMAVKAQQRKSNLSIFADKLASQFIWGVLIIALFTGVYWWFKDSSLWLPIVISTLVVACPCALSLATPSAMVAAMSALTNKGILPVTGRFLEGFPDVNHVIFDKTGTLTTGDFSLHRLDVMPGLSESEAISLAKALNRDSSHPIANALRSLQPDPVTGITDIRHSAGGGVSAMVDGTHWAIGSERFVQKLMDLPTNSEIWPAVSPGSTACVLANGSGVQARFELVDTIRSDAKRTIEVLRSKNIDLSIYSGDNTAAVSTVAASLGIEDFQGGLLPEEKLQQAKKLADSGKRIAVVGDGLNDAPLMTEAFLSVSMGRGADLSKSKSDIVLMRDSLFGLIDAIEISQKTIGVIRQNYIWAAGYNLLAIPAAAFGLLPPWVAALGMSISSLIVSINALRLVGKKAPVDSANNLSYRDAYAVEV